MRPPQHHRSAYLRDCVQLSRVRRRVEESPHMTKAEKDRGSEMLRLVMELIDRTTKKAREPSTTRGRAARSANGGKSAAA